MYTDGDNSTIQIPGHHRAIFRSLSPLRDLDVNEVGRTEK